MTKKHAASPDASSPPERPTPQALPSVVIVNALSPEAVGSIANQHPDVLVVDLRGDGHKLDLFLEDLLRAVRSTPPDGVFSVGPIEVDTLARTVLLNGRPLSLRRLEYELLCTLIREPYRVFEKDRLLRDVWQWTHGHRSTRMLDQTAHRLRTTLRRDGDELVVNVWGLGYRLIDGES
ncbi:winged helix-turn-helix domain-containing protein [Conexibacter sp. CPCC 206217]|uniref:winged helix-turn-helix domain-containing protein n=1 Tax=Conexibacter sp. CPCC 206217 TaxID=3064574 RepID=UPI002717BA64|nr:winged helix-turn-helix domain-containing protein [Conexibacter sp. CPCC 206217]MDO8208974.1 winged helix-turn-helix domain-containing protein [Conexibacter sp. CPCC 206217]